MTLSTFQERLVKLVSSSYNVEDDIDLLDQLDFIADNIFNNQHRPRKFKPGVTKCACCDEVVVQQHEWKRFPSASLCSPRCVDVAEEDYLHIIKSIT